MMDTRQAFDTVQWIVEQGLRGAPETEILAGFCQRMVADGLPLLRVNVSQPTLHPTVGGHLFIWHRDNGTVEENWERSIKQTGQAAEKSPFYAMINEGLPELRIRLSETNEGTGFPLVDQLREQGATDYLIWRTSFGTGDQLGTREGLFSSWATDQPGGFRDEDLASIRQVLPTLSYAVKAASTYRIANSMVETYLGKDAGGRVLSGEILRGSGETIKAVLWYCDLQGFTRLSETTPRDQLIELLNDYFELMVGKIQSHGGDVLKFMGDGLLAIFRLDGDEAGVCREVLDAAEQAIAGVVELNESRWKAGLPVSSFYTALHLGDLNYGNIGSPDRLDFTVVGPAVNEVSRIESLCRSLDQELIISSAFADAADGSRDRLVSLGRYALRGVRRPQELFTLAVDG